MLGVDLDEVVCDFVSCLADWHNVTYGTTLTPSHFRTYRFKDTWGGSDQESADKVSFGIECAFIR